MFKKLCLLVISLILFMPTLSQAQVQPTVSPLATAEPQPESLPELFSARKAVDHFLSSMDDYASGSSKALTEAVKCLDLSEIPEFVRKEQGASLSYKLFSVLIRTKFERSKIPDKDQGDSYVLRDDEKGKIILEKAGPNWKFSRATVRNIPDLYSNVKDEKILRAAALEFPLEDSDFNLRQSAPDFLKGKIFSVEYWQLIGIIAGAFAAWLLQLFSFYVSKHAINFALRKSDANSSMQSINRFVAPLSYLCAAYAFHAVLFLLDLDPVVYARLLRILQIIKISALIFVCWRFIDLVVSLIEPKVQNTFGSSGHIVLPLISKTAKFFLLFFGLMLAASLFNINFTGLVAGLGIGGLALALAAKDTVENLFGSLTVLIDRPFKVGDSITIEGVTGSVENIGLRSTRLRTPENSLLTIPNSKLISVMVDNLGARKFFRTRVSIGIVYETPIDKLQLFCKSMRELLENNEAARGDYIVNFNEFASSSLNILIQVYFQAPSYAEYLNTQEEFFISIIKTANQLGVEFAYPVQRTVTDRSADSPTQSGT